jgi:hypothetical protein
MNTAVSDVLLLLERVGPVCKRLGVSKLRVGDIELDFGSNPAVGDVSDAQMKAFRTELEKLEKSMPSEEDVLFHSAPGMPPPKGPEPELPKTVRGRKM